MIPLLGVLETAEHVHLVVGGNSLAAARVAKCQAAGARVVLVSPRGGLAEDLHRRIEEGKLQWHDREFEMEDLTTLGREEVDYTVDAVFVTLAPYLARVSSISRRCRRLRIPVNVADAPGMCSFSLLATHSDGPLHIGVTTSGNGCKLASRIRREIAAALPSGLGNACTRMGRLRESIKREDGLDEAIEDDDRDQDAKLNRLVSPEDFEAAKARRVRWLSQICEYWPLGKLCSLSDSETAAILSSYITASAAPTTPASARGKISLVGSGPGAPGLLTTSALQAVQSAGLVLADKLVPEKVLALVPRRAELYIARKFPGNAEKAQEELLEMGLQALVRGVDVVRLKQGDPYIFGRGGEEVDFFTRHGYAPLIIPGITSALAAPLFAGIPATHRAVADQVLVCTGTGRNGAAPAVPEWVGSRTTVFLMALHRLEGMVAGLAERGWPLHVPCAVVERASCKDQRVVRSTLANVVEAVATTGSRPPGLLVVGWACEVLQRGPGPWHIEEGLDPGWDVFEGRV